MAFNSTMLKDGTRQAGADLSGSQFLAVKLNTSGQVVACAAATDYPYGILLNAPTSGQVAEVCIAGITKMVAGGSVTAADQITITSAGKAATCTPGTDTTKYKIGQAITGGASNEVITVNVNFAAAGRAA